MQKLNHDNVLSLIGISVHKDAPCLIIPFMCNGDMKSYLVKHASVSIHTDLLKVCNVCSSIILLIWFEMMTGVWCIFHILMLECWQSYSECWYTSNIKGTISLHTLFVHWTYFTYMLLPGDYLIIPHYLI